MTNQRLAETYLARARELEDCAKQVEQNPKDGAAWTQLGKVYTFLAEGIWGIKDSEYDRLAKEALQKAIDDNAPKAQIKTALAKYQASQKAKRDKLAQAQENLRKYLNTKQEAQATLLGLLE